MTAQIPALKAIIDTYNELLADALKVASELHLAMDAAYDGLLALGIDDDNVTIGFPSNDSYDPGMGWSDTISFPVAFLTAEGDERVEMIAKYHADAAETAKAEAAAYAARREADELRKFVELKAKFEPSPAT